jgi:hypothetical protein
MSEESMSTTMSNSTSVDNPHHEQKEPQMTTQEHQVTVHELQRLNDAIAMTMDAIRRVVPQIAVLHAQTQQSLPFGQPTVGYGYGIGYGANPWTQPTFGFGGGIGTHVDPITAAYVQTQALRQLYGVGVNSYGFSPTQSWQNPYGFGFQGSPFVSLGQRI